MHKPSRCTNLHDAQTLMMYKPSPYTNPPHLRFPLPHLFFHLPPPPTFRDHIHTHSRHPLAPASPSFQPLPSPTNSHCPTAHVAHSTRTFPSFILMHPSHTVPPHKPPSLLTDHSLGRPTHSQFKSKPSRSGLV